MRETAILQTSEIPVLAAKITVTALLLLVALPLFYLGVLGVWALLRQGRGCPAALALYGRDGPRRVKRHRNRSGPFARCPYSSRRWLFFIWVMPSPFLSSSIFRRSLLCGL